LEEEQGKASLHVSTRTRNSFAHCHYTAGENAMGKKHLSQAQLVFAGEYWSCRHGLGLEKRTAFASASAFLNPKP
jgi:hypothetical protein